LAAVLLFAGAIGLHVAAVAEPYKAQAGPFAVAVELGSWSDAARAGREVPYQLYLPQSAPEPLPIVVWSHGAGGSRDGAEYLGRHLASHGYAVFHLQHAGSDAAVLRQHGREGMLREVARPAAAQARFEDVPFAVERIVAMNAEGPLAGRLDPERMGMSGHSYGAISTMVAAGQSSPEAGQRYAVPRFKGAFAMSPGSPRRGSAEEAFEDMLMPIFHLTGTADGSPLGDLEPSAREQPFRIIDDVDQYLLVLQDGVHMTFSGRDAGYPKLARHHDLIRMAAVAFWDSRLRGDGAARAWLDDGGFAAELGADGRFERKTAVAAAAASAARPCPDQDSGRIDARRALLQSFPDPLKRSSSSAKRTLKLVSVP
jgi:predicted dienelactone hydrolase